MLGKGSRRSTAAAKKRVAKPADTEPKGTIALERGLSILLAFTTDEPVLTLSDLSRKTGINKATLLRFLHTLERFKYVGRSSDGAYHVGPGGLWLGRLYQASLGEGEAIRACLERVVKITKESASFMVKEGDVRICVYRVNSPHQIRDHVEIGDIRPLGKGAPGKILAAFSEETPSAQYSDVRASCFCSSRNEIERDAAGAAVPVFRMDGLAGALTVTGPVNRMDEFGEERLRTVLLTESINLTSALGGSGMVLRRALSRIPTSNELLPDTA